MSPEIEVLEVILLTLCLLLAGFFSGAEVVLLSIGIDRAKQLHGEGGSKERALAFMVERPNELLATILVGNNIVNILAASITTTIATRFFANDAIGVTVGVLTIVILIFGEVVPKSFARGQAEVLSIPVIRILQAFYYIFYPIVKVLVLIIRGVLGENAELTGRLVTKDDLEYMVNKAEKEKTIDSKQLDLIHSVLEFPTIKVRDIMIPRNRVKYIKYGLGFKEISEKIVGDIHSRYPVCQDELEHTKGLLHVKDIAFLSDQAKENFDITKYLKDPCFVYEHMKIQSVFDYMNKKKIHLALVKDENGLVVGIVSLEDIVEEILGDIHDEHDDENVVERNNKESNLKKGILVDGSISLRDFYNEFDIKIPLNDNYSTLAGLILDTLGNSFPEEGKVVSWEGLAFELVKVDDEFEIKEILVKNIEDKRPPSQSKMIRGDLKSFTAI